MSDNAASPDEIRIRCACGRRYRIRHARAGMVLTCTRCQRAIRVTEADLRAAESGIPLAPVQRDPDERREAVVMPSDELRIAPKGSRPGRTGRLHQTDDDLARAVGREAFASNQPTSSLGGAGDADHAMEPLLAASAGAFLKDLLASLYLAGRPRNAVGLAAMSVVCAIPFIVNIVLGPFSCLVLPLTLIFMALALLSIAQFMWNTLSRTAAGDDDIPLFEPDWDWVDDGLKPLLWLLGISLLCFGPAELVRAYVDDSPQKPFLVYLAQFAGAFLFPVAVMSAALGNSIAYLRPDWLVRCILGIGPLYIVAWLLVVGTYAAWDHLPIALEPLGEIPLAGPLLSVLLYTGISIYMFYVVFRTMGLLFRYFRHRFPWQF